MKGLLPVGFLTLFPNGLPLACGLVLLAGLAVLFKNGLPDVALGWPELLFALLLLDLFWFHCVKRLMVLHAVLLSTLVFQEFFFVDVLFQCLGKLCRMRRRLVCWDEPRADVMYVKEAPIIIIIIKKEEEEGRTKEKKKNKKLSPPYFLLLLLLLIIIITVYNYSFITQHRGIVFILNSVSIHPS